MSPRRHLALSWLLACSLPWMASAGESMERGITVTGTAVTTTVPDRIVWRLTTTDFNRNLLQAKEQSDVKLKAVLGLQKELGIRMEDMQTGWLSIRKEFERDRYGNRGAFKHFAVTRKITVKQRELDRFDEYLTKFVSSAELEVEFEFESSRVHELRRETRLKAVRVAREKAAAMTEVLGVRPGKVLSVDEQIPYQGFSNIASNSIYMDPAGGQPPDITSGTFAPGAIEVRISVQVTFEIES